MVNNSFEDFVIRTIVDRVDYDPEKDRYIVNNIVLTDEILSKLLKFAHQNRIEEGKAREIIINIAKYVSVESEVSYHQTNVNTNDIRPGCIFLLYFNNITYGRLCLELLCLNEKRSYLVLDTNIPGLKYKDILESRNQSWNYGFAVDFGILRNGYYFPGPSNYLLLEKFEGIEYHAPTYIHKVLDKFYIKEQKGISKKGQNAILELIDLVDVFISSDFSKDHYNFLLSEALSSNLSSFQLNVLIKRAKCNFIKASDEQEELRSFFSKNSGIIRVFQQPIIIKEHEQEYKRKIKELSDEIDLLKGQKLELKTEVNSLNIKLKKHIIKHDKLLNDYNDFVKKVSNTNSNMPKAFFGWFSVIAMLLSTNLITFMVCGGFSQDKLEKSPNIPKVTKSKTENDDEQRKNISLPIEVAHIPNTFVHISFGTRDFYIDKFEVTQKDYERIMGCNPSKFKGDSIPVHGMSVRDAVLYCNKKSYKDGYDGFYEINDKMVTIKENGNGYRLPTEEEWMLAAKKSKLNNAEISCFPYHRYSNEVNGKLEPHLVGAKESEGKLLYDIYGNVCELCVRSNGEIWGKGGSFQNQLRSEGNENAGFRVADNISSTKKRKEFIFGLRLVLTPKN